MAELKIYEILFGGFVAIFLFRDLVIKRLLITRLKDNHPEIWERMGSPKATVFSMKEPHWTLVGIDRDFRLCASLGMDDTSRETRALVYRYRVFSVLEGVAVVAMMAAILADR